MLQHWCVKFMHFSVTLSIQWKRSNRKQGARWQHISQLKASAFCIWKNKLWWFKTQQLILGTGSAIWWVTEPHLKSVLLHYQNIWPSEKIFHGQTL